MVGVALRWRSQNRRWKRGADAGQPSLRSYGSCWPIQIHTKPSPDSTATARWLRPTRADQYRPVFLSRRLGCRGSLFTSSKAARAAFCTAGSSEPKASQNAGAAWCFKAAWIYLPDGPAAPARRGYPTCRRQHQPRIGRPRYGPRIRPASPATHAIRRRKECATAR